MRELYLPRLKTALLRYASLKRATGDLAGANTLEARAAALVSAPDTPAAGDKPNWPRRSRTVGGIIITEPPNARLTDDDLAQIHAVLRPKGKRVARLQVSGEVRLGGSGRTEPDWGVDAVFEPEIAHSSAASRNDRVGGKRAGHGQARVERARYARLHAGGEARRRCGGRGAVLYAGAAKSPDAEERRVCLRRAVRSRPGRHSTD